MTRDLKATVGDNHKARFSRYRGTTVFAELKASTLLRSVRKASEDKTCQPANQLVVGTEGRPPGLRIDRL